MLDEKRWDMLSKQMFEDAYFKFTESDAYREYNEKYNKMLESIHKKYDKTTADMLCSYLYQSNALSLEEAKEMYLTGMKDVILLLKKLNVLM